LLTLRPTERHEHAYVVARTAQSLTRVGRQTRIRIRRARDRSLSGAPTFACASDSANESLMMLAPTRWSRDSAGGAHLPLASMPNNHIRECLTLTRKPRRRRRRRGTGTAMENGNANGEREWGTRMGNANGEREWGTRMGNPNGEPEWRTRTRNGRSGPAQSRRVGGAVLMIRLLPFARQPRRLANACRRPARH
jgi:hypothetical protein